MRIASDKPGKFGSLQNKFKDRFNLSFVIDVGNIGKMEAGFDNHHNHYRPHIHIDTKIKGIGKISIALDNGELLHKRNKNLDKGTLNSIKDWVLERGHCLKLIYENIENCKDKSDFEPLINAMNKYF